MTDSAESSAGDARSPLERYQHLAPLFRAQTVDLIAQVLLGDTPTNTPAPEEERDEANSTCSKLAGWTGLEPATSDVTGRRSNQLNYHPAKVGPRTNGATRECPGESNWWAVEDSNL